MDDCNLYLGTWQVIRVFLSVLYRHDELATTLEGNNVAELLHWAILSLKSHEFSVEISLSYPAWHFAEII